MGSASHTRRGGARGEGGLDSSALFGLASSERGGDADTSGGPSVDAAADPQSAVAAILADMLGEEDSDDGGSFASHASDASRVR